MIEIVAAFALLLVLVVGSRSWSNRAGDRRSDRSRMSPGVGERILVAVSHPASGETLGEVAAALARADAGRVSALTVLDPTDTDDVRSLSRAAIDRCEAVAIEGGLRAGGRLRVDTSVATGILHETVEGDASLLVLGWPRLGADGGVVPTVADAIARVPCPLLLARLQGYQWHRIALRVPATSAPQGLEASLRLATGIAERLRDQHRIPLDRLPKEHARADPTQLVVVPVEPAEDAIERALRETAPLGDVLLALCHGPRAAHGRQLLSSAAELYAPPPS